MARYAKKIKNMHKKKRKFSREGMEDHSPLDVSRKCLSGPAFNVNVYSNYLRSSLLIQ